MDTGKNKKIAIFAITAGGAETGRRLKIFFPDSRLFLSEKLSTGQALSEDTFSSSLKEAVSQAFKENKYLVLIMAAGIAVRLLVPLVKDKHSDPGVVVVDDKGSYAISLLSGHAGGANELARQVAACLGAQPVITTGSDVFGKIPADILGRENGWKIENSKYLDEVCAAVVNGEAVGIFQDAGEIGWRGKFEPLPDNVRIFPSLKSLSESHARAALVITDRVLDKDETSLLSENILIYRPRSLVVGIGCNRRTGGDVIEKAINQVFSQYKLSIKSIKKLATIDLKRDEEGILDFARKYDLSIDYFDKESLSQAKYPSPASPTVRKHVGTPAVAESAALLSSGGPIIVPKTGYRGAVTVAVARLPFANGPKNRPGKLFVVGTGPGGPADMTLRAREAIEKCEIVVGYKNYVDLIKPILVQKKVISTGMGAEIERMTIALEIAREGKTVAVISSGDAGVYGMAGLLGEILGESSGDEINIEVVPGVPALAAAAALLGSPLNTDFACISLSDHLTPWEEIQARLKQAAQADFVIVIHNPKSHQRPHRLAEAREIILHYHQPANKVGIVTNAYREGQQIVITDLEHMLDYQINMNTIVIIGNSNTLAFKNWLVTPRGYQRKYGPLKRS